MDIYASQHQKKINHDTHYFVLDENKHLEVFNKAKPDSQYLSLNQLRDYYSDHTVLFNEIKDILNELKSLGYDNNDSFYNFLNESYEKKLNLYAYCD